MLFTTLQEAWKEKRQIQPSKLHLNQLCSYHKGYSMLFLDIYCSPASIPTLLPPALFELPGTLCQPRSACTPWAGGWLATSRWCWGDQTVWFGKRVSASARQVPQLSALRGKVYPFRHGTLSVMVMRQLGQLHQGSGRFSVTHSY